MVDYLFDNSGISHLFKGCCIMFLLVGLLVGRYVTNKDFCRKKLTLWDITQYMFKYLHGLHNVQNLSLDQNSDTITMGNTMKLAKTRQRLDVKGNFCNWYQNCQPMEWSPWQCNYSPNCQYLQSTGKTWPVSTILIA